EVLLEPTRIYVKAVLQLLRAVPVKGLAHITGGGLIDNVPRILSEHLCAELERGSWAAPPLFAWLRDAGNVAEAEMLRVFNCGIGMVAIVAERDAAKSTDVLRAAGETVWRIGTVRERAPGEEQVVVA